MASCIIIHEDGTADLVRVQQEQLILYAEYLAQFSVRILQQLRVESQKEATSDRESERDA